MLKDELGISASSALGVNGLVQVLSSVLRVVCVSQSKLLSGWLVDRLKTSTGFLPQDFLSRYRRDRRNRDRPMHSGPYVHRIRVRQIPLGNGSWGARSPSPFLRDAFDLTAGLSERGFGCSFVFRCIVKRRIDLALASVKLGFTGMLPL